MTLAVMDLCSLVQAICTRFLSGGALDVVVVGVSGAVAALFQEGFRTVPLWALSFLDEHRDLRSVERSFGHFR